MLSNKSIKGQFYTTNYKYILKNMYIPEFINFIVEPFAGNGDLLKFINQDREFSVEAYDIEPKQQFITQRDTLLECPCYDGKFVITNPPYLARNKNKCKTLYDKYKTNDLYKCFIIQLIESSTLGGIIIVPLNFISSIRKADIILRKNFLSKFYIKLLNIFEEKVFDDTGYSVCSIQFEARADNFKTDTLYKITVYPSETNYKFELSDKTNYTIGGEIYNLPQNKYYKITRAVKDKFEQNCITNIMVKCIDDTDKNKIKMKFVENANVYIDNTPNLSARSYATLVITPSISLEKQKELIDKFNNFMEINRQKYNSLFLTNYRESKDIARKRISFDLVFKITSYLLLE